jgi:hypothetical protein
MGSRRKGTRRALFHLNYWRIPARLATISGRTLAAICNSPACRGLSGISGSHLPHRRLLSKCRRQCHVISARPYVAGRPMVGAGDNITPSVARRRRKLGKDAISGIMWGSVRRPFGQPAPVRWHHDPARWLTLCCLLYNFVHTQLCYQAVDFLRPPKGASLYSWEEPHDDFTPFRSSW